MALRPVGSSMEQLDRDVGVGVDLAQVREHAAVELVLDDLGELLLHRELEVVSQRAHDLVAPDVDQRALDDREAAFEQAQHRVVDQERLRAHRTLAVEALVQPHGGVRDLRQRLTKAPVGFGSLIVPLQPKR